MLGDQAGVMSYALKIIASFKVAEVGTSRAA
jgi:hypothetical protein